MVGMPPVAQFFLAAAISRSPIPHFSRIPPRAETVAQAVRAAQPDSAVQVETEAKAEVLSARQFRVPPGKRPSLTARSPIMSQRAVLAAQVERAVESVPAAKLVTQGQPAAAQFMAAAAR